MRFLSAMCLALIFVTSLRRLDAQQVAASPDPKTVSVLYATNTQSAFKRGNLELYENSEADIKEMVAFLEKHFSKVGVFDRSKYSFSEAFEYDFDLYDFKINGRKINDRKIGAFEKAAMEYDVVVVNWKSMVPKDNAPTPRSQLEPSSFESDSVERYMKWEREWSPFPQEFSKPMVIMGVSVLAMTPEETSEILHDELQTMPWKIALAGDYTYATDSKHSIFKEPLSVPIEWENINKPVSFYLYPGTQDTNETMRAWKVQNDTAPPRPRGVSCSRRYFDKTTDAEVITCGTAEAPDSVMIGRHGNRLIWGYSSDPDEMTPAGQAAFVNAICYMKNFNGKLPEGVPKARDPRHEFLESIYLMRAATNVYANANENEIEKLYPGTPGEKLSTRPAYYAKLFQKSGQEYVEKRMKSLPRDISDPFDGNVEEIVMYYTDNYEYLYLDPRHRYVVDEEAKALGLTIRSPDFLKRCIDLLDSGKDSESALVLLRRYAGKVAETPEQWRAWYESDGKTWVLGEYTTKFYPREPSDE